MPQKRRLAVIGLGMAVTPHARSLLDLADRVEVAHAFSRSAARRQAFAERFDFPLADDLARILADETVSAVLILTPPATHLELVERFAAAGKHILLEKPVERSTERAEALVKAAETAGVRLGVVFQSRFREASLALRARLAEGALGELAAANVACPWWRPQSYYDEPGRGTLARDGGGVLITQAIHTLDLALSLTGPVAEVAAVCGTTRVHRMETEDFAGAGLRFANGALGALFATTAEYPGFARAHRADRHARDRGPRRGRRHAPSPRRPGRAHRRGAEHRRRRRPDGLSPRRPPRAADRLPRRPRPGPRAGALGPRGATGAPLHRRGAALVGTRPHRQRSLPRRAR